MQRLLKSVGQRVFVTYYRDFCNPTLSTADLAGRLAAEGFSEKACRSRATHGRRIFAEGLEFAALKYIAASTRRGNENTARMAADLLSQLGSVEHTPTASCCATSASTLVAAGESVAQAQDDIALMPIVPVLMVGKVDDDRLSEITDSAVLARITQVIPTAVEVAARTASTEALKSMEVYRAVLPCGQTLAKSKAMPGAYRGFARVADDFGSNFAAQANFLREDPSKLVAWSNGLANAMNVAALIVGQYYMSQLNDRLEVLTESVKSLQDFNEAEFKSRIISLICHVAEVSQFSVEILEDDDLRKIKWASLENLKRDATQLLGQVNEAIEQNAGRSANPNPNLGDYTKRCAKISLLLEYQAVLLAVLGEISELDYLLCKGSQPAEMSAFQLRKFTRFSMQANERLAAWHKVQVKRLDIDLDRERKVQLVRLITVQAIYAGLALYARQPPRAVPERVGYTPLRPGLAQLIRTQSQAGHPSTAAFAKAYDRDVEVVIKGGKCYYLHEPSDIDSLARH